MKGGSIASDAVTELVNEETYSKMNGMFENAVPSSKSGGGCGCNKVGTGGACSVHKRGGNIVRRMLSNTTVNALKGGNAACGTRANAGSKQGGNLPSMAQLIESNASFDMRVQNRQTGGSRPRRTQQRGGANDNKSIEINPKLDFQSYSFTPKPPLVASPIDVIASEGVSALPLMQKYTMYGQTSQLATPFSYGQPARVTPMEPIQTSVITGMEMKGGKGKTKAPVKPAAKSTPKSKAKVVTKPQPPKKKTAATGKSSKEATTSKKCK